VKSGLRGPLPLTLRLGLAAAFTVNAALESNGSSAGEAFPCITIH